MKNYFTKPSAAHAAGWNDLTKAEREIWAAQMSGRQFSDSDLKKQFRSAADSHFSACCNASLQNREWTLLRTPPAPAIFESGRLAIPADALEDEETMNITRRWDSGRPIRCCVWTSHAHAPNTPAQLDEMVWVGTEVWPTESKAVPGKGTLGTAFADLLAMPESHDGWTATLAVFIMEGYQLELSDIQDVEVYPP